MELSIADKKFNIYENTIKTLSLLALIFALIKSLMTNYWSFGFNNDYYISLNVADYMTTAPFILFVIYAFTLDKKHNSRRMVFFTLLLLSMSYLLGNIMQIVNMEKYLGGVFNDIYLTVLLFVNIALTVFCIISAFLSYKLRKVGKIILLSTAILGINTSLWGICNSLISINNLGEVYYGAYEGLIFGGIYGNISLVLLFVAFIIVCAYSKYHDGKMFMENN